MLFITDGLTRETWVFGDVVRAPWASSNILMWLDLARVVGLSVVAEVPIGRRMISCGVGCAKAWPDTISIEMSNVLGPGRFMIV